jgi:TonB family protein
MAKSRDKKTAEYLSVDASKILAALPVTFLWWSVSADAQQMRCDCTSVVDTCSADIVSRGSYLEIKTDKQQCARVDYFVDGQPFVSVVTGGEDRQDWLARTEAPKIMVQSCQVCRDNTDAPAVRPRAAAVPPPVDEQASDELEPLIAGTPEYPVAARQRRVEGFVDVEFTVNAAGNVESPRVAAAQPTGVFDAAALAAVARWRYAPAPDRAPLALKERVEFKLGGIAPTAAPTAAPGTAGPRNQCVREDVVYHYGESVDVDLMNACSDPLMVFGCAEGTGRYAGRWLCSDSEQQGNVLVTQTDRRLGNRFAAGTEEGVRTFTYTDGFSVTRAPNSQYWWIACTESDTGCLAEARQWVRAVAGQPSSVDPQDRSRVEIARSN